MVSLSSKSTVYIYYFYIILDSIKIPSEKKDLLVPFFKRIKAQYGRPVTLVHDMGKGILAAVEEVFPGIPDFIFHFLRDIGKDLFGKEYKIYQKNNMGEPISALIHGLVDLLEIPPGQIAVTDPSRRLLDSEAQARIIDRCAYASELSWDLHRGEDGS